jgi:DNA-binding response OmpR family regulator
MSDSRVVLNQLVIDMAVRRVSYRDQIIPLTKLEFDLLAYLVQHKERICTY